MLLFDARRQMIAELIEILALTLEVIFPVFPVNTHQLFKIRFRNFKPTIQGGRFGT